MINPQVSISASAGSGKTYRLVHQFLGILHAALFTENRKRQPEAIERTLAATFTRAAAAEIVDRILKRIALAAIDQIECEKLRAALNTEQLSREQCQEMLHELVTRLNRVRIGTIDSFLVRSAQAFSTELGLPDRWSILDDSADYAASLDAVDELLEAKALDTQEFNRMVDLIVMLHQHRFPVQIREKVVQRLRDTQAALAAGPAAAWEAIAPAEGDLMLADVLASEVAGFAAGFQPMIPLTSKGLPNANWVKAVAKLVESAKAGGWDPMLTSGLIAAMANLPPSYYKIELTNPMIACLDPLKRHAAASILDQLLRRNQSTRDMLSEYVGLYAKMKARQAGYRFDDFPAMLLDADVSEDLADFYYRLDGQIDHILLDEFQDTSIPQWKLIKPLVSEIVSGEGASGAERSFFCVGDVKQTLYGWRNAEPLLLGEIGREWPQITQEYLVSSRRSVPVIIKTVNAIFGSLATNASLQPADVDHAYLANATELWSTWFQKHQTVPEKDNDPGFARLLSCADGDDTADRQHQARLLAVRRAVELHELRPQLQIAILVRRKAFIAPLLAMLRSKSLRASGEGGSQLADDMAVCVVLSLLHLIDHPSDSAALFHLTNSPLGEALGFAHNMDSVQVLKKATELRTAIFDAGLGASINRWMGLCAAGCDARNFRRLEQLVEMAHGYDYDGGAFSAFIDAVKAARVEDQEASNIRVMTIHASKGREFDYVILPDLDGNFISGSGGPSVLFQRPELMDLANVITTKPSPAACAVDPRLERMSQAWRTRQVVEELCALYVAVTRAKTGLEMIVHPAQPKKSGDIAMPKSAAGVLRAALFGTQLVNPEAELWAQGEIPNGTAADASTIVAPPAPFVELNLIAPTAPSRVRPVVAPSALEGAGHIQLDHVLRINDARGREWGTVMHRWFEMVKWLDDAPPTDVQLREAAGELEVGISAGQIDEMIRQFKATCERPNVGGLLRQANYLQGSAAGSVVEVWRERPFVVPMQTGEPPTSVIVRGQIDRVVVVKAGGKVIRADVIDYKTDKVDAAGLAEKRAHYAPQVAAYRNAVVRMLGIAATAVSAKLVFIRIDAVLHMN